ITQLFATLPDAALPSIRVRVQTRETLVGEIAEAESVRNWKRGTQLLTLDRMLGGDPGIPVEQKFLDSLLSDIQAGWRDKRAGLEDLCEIYLARRAQDGTVRRLRAKLLMSKGAPMRSGTASASWSPPIRKSSSSSRDAPCVWAGRTRSRPRPAERASSTSAAS